jgi:deoxycytidine triphosphate deaminase
MTDEMERTASRFADSEEEAERRFNEFRSKDPFPSIVPALLNSADISDYVAATGMIYPFEDGEERLKSASYRIDLEGECIYWEEDGEKKSCNVKKGDSLILKPNSIVFVTIEPMFRIPNYIALRFNLQISHVYKGLLVGTGPLVDPGFKGKLHLPLHNLTANEYTLKGGDAIIWMEFTKLSTNTIWENNDKERQREGSFRGFQERKNKLTTIDDYIEKAVGRDRKVISSIPYAIEKSQRNAIEAKQISQESKVIAETAKSTVENMKETLRDEFFAIKLNSAEFEKTLVNRVGIISFIFALAFILPSFTLSVTAIYNFLSTRDDVKVLKEKSVPALDKDLKDVKDDKIKTLETDIESLKKQNSELENKLKQAGVKGF